MKLLTPFKLLVLVALLLCVLHANAASSLITFADPEVERICVENWDADGDGILSEKEAESVSWLSWMVFSGKPITTFDELAYFKNLRTIGQAAFGQCKNLKSIKIPKSVTEIGMSAFADCISLVSIDIPKGVTEIQNWAFENCQSLTSISLPEGVITLKEKAFFGCSGLKTITLPSTIQEIGNYVFYGLASIQDVYCYATVVPQVTANSFSNNIAEGSNLSNATLHVPVGCVDAYRNAQGWKVFNNIVEFEVNGAPANVEAVDLGLPSGTRWASCNVGATKPEEYGGYYAWGETEEKEAYIEETYKYYQNGEYVNIGSDISGTEYDVARMKWGGNWCVPYLDDIEELLDNCTSEWTALNGVNGFKFTGPNGNSIFLPAAGDRWNGVLENLGEKGYYLSSTLFHMGAAYDLYFRSGYADRSYSARSYGRSVRPVEKPKTNDVPAEAIDLGLPSGTKWANMNVGASKPEEYGMYFAWGETSAKSSYSWDNYMCPEMACGKPGDPVFDLVGDKADIAGTKFDAAAINWGASWNMPTAKQVEELASNCYSSLVTINGVQCRKLTSRINGNEIIFPLAGARWFEDFAYEGSLCYYWASTLRQGGYVSPGRLIIEDDRHGWGWSTGGENDRFCGFPIRPVMRTTVADPNLTLGTKVLMLTEGEAVALTYTYEPADADISALKWTTSDSSIATVNHEGVVTAVCEGSCTITVSCGSLGQQECRVIVNNVTGTSSGHEYVDLGLPSGTLWATTNVGAETPDEIGNLLSWVETQGDVVSASWGAYWRLPQREQLEELLAGTSLVYTSLNGTEGFLLTSLTNGKCIFLSVTNSTGLPLRGCFWSGTSDGGSTAYALNITSAAGDVLSFNASEHLAVRLVYDESVGEGSMFTVKAGGLDFGSVAVGNRRSMSFDIHNNTFGVINVQPFGIDADDFFIDWTGGEIQPNATQPVTVTYSPTKESVAAGGSLLIATATDSSFVNVAATSHKGSDELTTKANLVVWCKNGAKVTFLLNDKPIVMIKDGKWKIDGKNASAEYDVADVVKMTYDGIPDDIPAIEVGSENPFALDAEALTFYSDSEDLHVRIVTSSGVIVRQFVAHCGTASSVPLSQFAPGVYIVNVNNISYKISIR